MYSALGFAVTGPADVALARRHPACHRGRAVLFTPVGVRGPRRSVRPPRRRPAAPPRMQVRRDFGTSTTDEIAQFISDNLGRGTVTSMQRAGSSGWAVMHKAVTDTGARFFVKVSRGDEMMFAGEAEGLGAMFKTGTLRVPEVYHYGPLSSGEAAFIVMEELTLETVYGQSVLGRSLAEMHLAEPAAAQAREGKFGFDVENTIGGTLQPNGWMDSWVEFFRERRLRHQLLLTGDSELLRVGDRVCERMDDLFASCGDVKPSILHGDLWSGNINAAAGVPVVFDPACYYGHHEAEFGMSWCAGFTPNFWAAYRDLIPKAPGFKERHNLYTAYHALNHYNLFRGGYKAMALACLNRLA
jgi:protein-ribulosamine 3-kinase